MKKLAGAALKYGVIAWGAAFFVWYLIVSTLRNGISCDEGYYLMGYLHNQAIESLGTDFHSIVRAICPPFSDDNIMVFRYVRLFLNILAILLFGITSYEWLSRKKELQVNRWAYYPMVALAGAMSFTFAAPTISYDSLGLIIILFASSVLFVLFTSENGLIRSICAFGIGFLLWFALINYPPAGVCVVVLLITAYFLEADNKRWIHLLFALLGVAFAIILSNYCIHDFKDWASEAGKVFVSTFTEESKSRHDAGSLVFTMIKTIGKTLLFFLPIVVLFFIIYQKTSISENVQWLIVLLLCAVLIVVRSIYELRGLLYIIPVALILAKVLSEPTASIKAFFLSKEALFTLVLITIPFAGVFGTNQPILKKIVIYAPFWLLAFFYLSTKVKPEAIKRLALLFITILFAGYFWLGNFQRYHYYYTPRSSRYELVNASRTQKVMVSQYQQQYYKDLFDTLQVSGCKPGDAFMAFGENQMAVYLAGGYISGRLPYHWWQYKDFDVTAPQAFILFKQEEDDVIDYFKKTDWGFPEDYERKEMRQMSQNMGDNLRTVIYIKK